MTTASEVIMLPGRAPEITVKFTTRPNIPEQGKKVILRLNGENRVDVQAILNRKNLKKQIDKVDGEQRSVAAVGRQMNLSWSRVRQIEAAALAKLRQRREVQELAQVNCKNWFNFPDQSVVKNKKLKK